MMQTRNPDQCAKRWQHVLGPDHKHDPWTPEEDRILQKAIAKYGNNWKQIGLLELPERSTHDIRNRVALNRRKRRSAAPLNHDPSSSTQYISDDNGDDNSSSGEESDMGSDAEGTNDDQHSTHPAFAANDMMEVDAAMSPSQAPTTMPESLADASFFSNWEMASPATMLTQVRPLDAESHPWLWFATESTSSGQTPDQHLSPENLSLAFESGQDMGSFMGNGEISPHVSQDENLASGSVVAATQPPPDYRGQAEAPGSVTVLLRQADSQLAQQVIGNLLNLNADVVIRLLKD
ncbi:hypothetical protein QBC41DRAFT_238024 [Cercophora samala]|uniref:Uncharacterized protein n=1 Tax=Cercophora samala TaxID=330535 RepID=A0AA39YVJ7_9PEZI|nr:hypothetical protein QBC41DRAFT_238024 [Cercophora samala]